VQAHHLFTIEDAIIRKWGHLYVRLNPGRTLGDGVKLGSARELRSASAFGATYDNTIDAVNNDEKLRNDLRRIAKELVRRRRARQKMGGPRWEVFVGGAVKANDREREVDTKEAHKGIT
jgi:hypothetical protein